MAHTIHSLLLVILFPHSVVNNSQARITYTSSDSLQSRELSVLLQNYLHRYVMTDWLRIRHLLKRHTVYYEKVIFSPIDQFMIRSPSPPPSLPSCLVTNIKKGRHSSKQFAQVSLVFYKHQTPGESRRPNTMLPMAETLRMLLARATEFIPSSASLPSS